MATPPPISGLAVEPLLDEEGGIDPKRLLSTLNQFIGPTHGALNGQLSVENLQAEWLDFEVRAGTDATRLVAEATSPGQTIAHNTTTVLNFINGVTDTHSALSASNSVFTVPEGYGGRFSVCAATIFDGAAGANIQLLTLKKNATSGYRRLFQTYAAAAQENGLAGSIDVDLSDGDTLSIEAYQSSGGNLSTKTLDAANWVAYTRLDDSPPAACFPVAVALKRLAYRPLGVFLAELRERDTNAIQAAGQLDWDWRSKDGKPHIFIRNIPGLSASTRYRGRLLVVGK